MALSNSHCTIELVVCCGHCSKKNEVAIPITPTNDSEIDVNADADMLAAAAEMNIASALEVSGNLTVENAANLPANREWFLSSGALTKHVVATDLSLRLQD